MRKCRMYYEIRANHIDFVPPPKKFLAPQRFRRLIRRRRILLFLSAFGVDTSYAVRIRILHEDPKQQREKLTHFTSNANEKLKLTGFQFFCPNVDDNKVYTTFRKNLNNLS